MLLYLKSNNLDGIDIDFENNALLIPYYNEFVVDLAAELHKKGKKISAAVANWSGDRINTPTLTAYDWINLMSYDLTAPWTPTTPGPHSPISKMTADYAYWFGTRGINKNKITIGVPLYGYEFVNATTVNTWTYNNICNQFPGAENQDSIFTGAGKLYYNGIPTINDKVLYAYQNAGGAYPLGKRRIKKELENRN